MTFDADKEAERISQWFFQVDDPRQMKCETIVKNLLLRTRRETWEEAAEIADKHKMKEHEDRECSNCKEFCCGCELCSCCSRDKGSVIAYELRSKAAEITEGK